MDKWFDSFASIFKIGLWMVNKSFSVFTKQLPVRKILVKSCVLASYAAALVLMGCTTYRNANVNHGEFEVYAPTPYYGAGTHLLPKVNYFRGAVSISLQNQKQDVQLHGLKNSSVISDGPMNVSDVEVVPESNADIRYLLNDYFITGYVDFFRVYMSIELGGRLGLDPYPYGLVNAGYNSTSFESGAYARFGVSKSLARYEGLYGKADCCDDYDWKLLQKAYSENEHLTNPDFSVGMYINFFLNENVSLNVANSIFFPWLFRSSLPVSDGDVDEDFDISIDFPFFMTLYAGFLVLPLEHFQVSIGGSFYYTPKADDVMLIFENSLSILF